MNPAGGRRRRDVAGHGHTHDLGSDEFDSANPTSTVLRMALTAVVVAVGVVAAAAMVVLWPSGDEVVPEGYRGEQVSTEITAIEKCPDAPNCLRATADIDGEQQHVMLPVGNGAPSFSVGDKILVNVASAEGAETGQAGTEQAATVQYSFLDFDRTMPLIWLTALFVLAVLLLSRWRGFASLVSLGLSLVVVTLFVVPALIDGTDPLAVALTASALIMIVAIYSSQGFSIRSSVAIVGTLGALAVAGTVGALFTSASHFTGFSDDSTKFLVAIVGDVDVRGLLLAGLIIGALGVLDDVTVTQTAAVWEIAAANPRATRRSMFASAMRIGRSHVSATVNTLVLAYVGASLPLLLLLSATNASSGDQLRYEGVAQEIVRGLAGGLGIIAAVPITTALAALVVKRT